jgi:hypothetical protein
MERRFGAMTALVLCMLPAAAEARPQVRFFRGTTVQATFTSTAGCLTTTVAVLAGDNVTREPPARDRFKSVFLSIDQIDECTAGDPIVQQTTGFLDNPDLVISWAGRLARVRGTVLMEDAHHSPPQNHLTTFDVAFLAGTRVFTVTRDHTIERTGDAVVVSGVLEQRRAASAAGFVVQEDGVNLISRAADPAGTGVGDLLTFMSRILTGEIAIQKR